MPIWAWLTIGAAIWISVSAGTALVVARVIAYAEAYARAALDTAEHMATTNASAPASVHRLTGVEVIRSPNSETD